MKLQRQVQLIRDLISAGNLKDAITKLRQMAEGSPNLNAVIIQAARLNTLQMEIVAGVTSYQDQGTARSQIAKAVLDLAAGIESEIKSIGQYWQTEINNTLDEIIRKHGVSPFTHQTITAHRNLDRTYYCLWIDDDPGNDQMEMQAIMGIGLECLTALNPYDAYKIMKSHKPDVIIINSLSRLKGDENEGIEFCRFLVKERTFSTIPVLLHSISFQKKWEEAREYNRNITSGLPKNIMNKFDEKNTLIIRDLIEEIVRVVFGADNIPESSDNPMKADDKLESSDSAGSTPVNSENVGTVTGSDKTRKTKPTPP